MNEKYPWLPTPPVFDPSRIRERITTDVIICGGGLAGVAAARAAAEAGAKCILFEKCATLQGRSGQFAVIGGELLKHWNIETEANKEKIVDALMEQSGPGARREMFRAVLDRIGEDFDWYLEGLPPNDYHISAHSAEDAPKDIRTQVTLMRYPLPENYRPQEEVYPVYPATVTITPSHVGVLRQNHVLAEQTGNLKTYFKTPVKQLLQDPETGRVTGVIAEDDQGNLIEAIARRAVILTTGDYSGDPAIMGHYFPEFMEHNHIPCGMTQDKTFANYGDGHKMGMWIGAALDDGPHSINCHSMGGAMGVTPFLMLDRNGRRFTNEDIPGHMVERKLMDCPGRFCWQLFDSAWPEQIPYMPLGHGSCSHILPEGDGVNRRLNPMDSFASQGFIDQQIQRGNTFRADTQEELAEKMGVPVETALESIRRYNTLAEAGRDEDFGKTAKRMFPLRNPPYYGSRIDTSPVLCCHSGLVSDPECRCYNTDGEVIPGLFVAGNVQGSRFSGDYPTVLPGISHSMALSYGRRAGINAAGYPGAES